MHAAFARVHRALTPTGLTGSWDGPAWRHADRLSIAEFHPRSTDHRPVTEARLLYDDDALHVLYRVQDRFVRSVHTEYDSDTYKDSCVELFVQPAGAPGYFALELNAGGAFSLRYIEDPTRAANRFAKWTMVDAGLASTIRVGHSLPQVVEPERSDPTSWWVEATWPFAVMEGYCGAVRPAAGQRWRANAFKCGDETSHPHWASWSPIGETLNFHQPQYFGEIEFVR
ncbi:MAG TPA: carbohydrate-binding family 9-like protein [Vicinamibacterales bacterium]|jgi:hypothetical protein